MDGYAPNAARQAAEDKAKFGRMRRQSVIDIVEDRIREMETSGDKRLSRASKGDLAFLKEIMDKGMEDLNMRDDNGETPLHKICRLGLVELVTKMIIRGADVNAITRGGRTPFMCAMEYGYENVAQVLMQRGADITAADREGQTALHIAAYYNQRNCIEMLLEKGLDVNARDHSDRTPLHIASFRCGPDVVKRLIAAGADPCVKDKRGNTPKMLATLDLRRKSVELLEHEMDELHKRLDMKKQ
eukprot:TRINITY_DN982_c0_g1::TRINITY_DN982_c0_g1_i1::g.15955::m.15955 TRINITY_DN982_c0_g1::TRINITY_DN982_c0_g1_i1::g.15955  ORF type:complete len:243 (-),score=44.49,sp/Q8Q0U0/Y045_METMA/31.72/4e-23,sp/Q8Q0U0/Y045_METMA/30.70/1e-21,sp/Q8Q0U0/Y045_METMA/34.78/1e-18,sp/Q8Q0U0/Y045_METMA/29.37/1e-14,sp/Q8Q0U0/Y045_METMA/28.69/2e-07,Ank/PF00023.25/3e+03,Ank/PF00023.25/0.00011,Ank/PF00023.25/4.2e-07,Ank/PF00023.25/4.6e-10,Ank/PF00023.25/6.7e-09,Ank/PF00023.25/3.9e+03,Ank_2/PF12796.2/2.7e-06,Ank_2/PF12796.2/1